MCGGYFYINVIFRAAAKERVGKFDNGLWHCGKENEGNDRVY
jgi:hypothetical protein